MFVIGVTGGVGSGKSRVLDMLRERYRCRILKADEAAHEVEAPDGLCHEALVALLREYERERTGQRPRAAAGQASHRLPPTQTASNVSTADAPGDACVKACVSEPPVFPRWQNPDGSLEPRALAALLFGDSALLARVNALVHPAVKRYIVQEIAAERERVALDFFFIEAALLIENGFSQIVDEMWYIYCEREERIRRLASSRGYTREKALSIMERQLSEQDFRCACDVTIDNSGSEAETMRQIDARLRILRGLSSVSRKE